MREYYPDFLKFVDDALKLAKKIPRYFSKFSNRIYCNHQKFAILILMQKLRKTSRGIVAWLRSNSEARLLLGLNSVPVHTTILRFAKQVNHMIGIVLGIRQAKTVAVDGTGFELESKSYYYRTAWNGDKRKRKNFLKLSLVVDTDKQLIMTYKIRRKQRNDTIDFKDILKELKVDHVLADRGYDSRSNRLFVIRKLKAMPCIPRRRISGPTYTQGQRKVLFNKELYKQRSKVETVFSVIKRKYGSSIRSRSFVTQRVELISKLIAYNIDRMSIFLIRIAPQLLNQTPSLKNKHIHN